MRCECIANRNPCNMSGNGEQDRKLLGIWYQLMQLYATPPSCPRARSEAINANNKSDASRATKSQSLPLFVLPSVSRRSVLYPLGVSSLTRRPTPQARFGSAFPAPTSRQSRFPFGSWYRPSSKLRFPVQCLR